jgi:tRNA threonylcarbamoyladenosine biosynthesis protein TsaE
MDLHRTFYTKTAEETKTIAKEMADSLASLEFPGAKVLCLYGELGSGKTTFVQGLAEGLHIHGRLLSPTFVFMRSYDISPALHFHHLDLYRLEQVEDLKSISFDELISDSQNIMVIEWADRLKSLLPKKSIDITFTTRDKDHEIKIESFL